MPATEPVKEALDHLLDPLEVSPMQSEIAPDDDAAAPSGPIGTYASRGRRANLASFFLRVRRSRRLLYKIPRILVAWTALVGGVCALIWITFGVAGLR
jgi:hypothetical protein